MNRWSFDESKFVGKWGEVISEVVELGFVEGLLGVVSLVILPVERR